MLNVVDFYANLAANLATVLLFLGAIITGIWGIVRTFQRWSRRQKKQ